jgi:hypothetical protein
LPARSAGGIRLAQSADVNLPAAASLTIDTSSGPLESTVRVSGILVIDTSPQLRACLLHIIERRVSPAIVIDLSGVSYLDASRSRRRRGGARRAHGVRLRVIAGRRTRMLLQVTEMDRIFLTRIGVEFTMLALLGRRTIDGITEVGSLTIQLSRTLLALPHAADRRQPTEWRTAVQQCWRSASAPCRSPPSWRSASATWPRSGGGGTAPLRGDSLRR